MAPLNSTAPTSSVFSVGTAGDVNYTTNSAEYITYLWHDVPGLQKFGNYTARGLEDGNFIECGFRPALVWIKGYGATYSPGHWMIHDNERDKFNPTAGSLQINNNNPEDTVGSAYYVDFVSNGFKVRNQGNAENGASGNKYLYCAWAEAPTFNLYGGQANAR